jgi:hypothetical protein
MTELTAKEKTREEQSTFSRNISTITAKPMTDKGWKYNNSFDYKYDEGKVLKEVINYIQDTYSSHYTNAQDDLQSIDVFAYRGTLGSTSIDNAIKYLMRYGKKEGKNEKDLIKAIHYLVLAIAFERKKNPQGQK